MQGSSVSAGQRIRMYVCHPHAACEHMHVRVRLNYSTHSQGSLLPAVPLLLMGSVDKAPSGLLLTETRSLWLLNGEDLLKKASTQAFTTSSPEVSTLRSSVAMAIPR